MFPLAEDFNKHILTPDLGVEELERLHADLRDLYRNYMEPNAPDRIQFDENIVSEIQDGRLLSVHILICIMIITL